MEESEATLSSPLTTFFFFIFLFIGYDFPKLNYPPYRTDNKVELHESSKEEEKGVVLEAKYNLTTEHNKAWVLAFHFLSAGNESWEAGLVLNHIPAVVHTTGDETGSGKKWDYDDTIDKCDGKTSSRWTDDDENRSNNILNLKKCCKGEELMSVCNDYEEVKDVMVILGKRWCKRVGKKTWPCIMSTHTSTLLTLKLRVSNIKLLYAVKECRYKNDYYYCCCSHHCCINLIIIITNTIIFVIAGIVVLLL